MDVMSAIQERRSIRSYSSRAVEEDKIGKVLEAARLSPSAGNRQEWKFIIIRDEEKRKKLADAAGGQTFVYQAPAVIVACGTETSRVMMCGQYCYSVDVSIAMAYMILEAWELGLGTCWLGHFDEKKVRGILDIPDGVRVVAMSPLGYPTESPSHRPRKELNRVACFDRYE